LEVAGKEGVMTDEERDLKDQILLSFMHYLISVEQGNVDAVTNCPFVHKLLGSRKLAGMSCSDLCVKYIEPYRDDAYRCPCHRYGPGKAIAKLKKFLTKEGYIDAPGY
jgi:hypothetical protein